jgi:hypothetical protein
MLPRVHPKGVPNCACRSFQAGSFKSKRRPPRFSDTATTVISSDDQPLHLLLDPLGKPRDIVTRADMRCDPKMQRPCSADKTERRDQTTAHNLVCNENARCHRNTKTMGRRLDQQVVVLIALLRALFLSGAVSARKAICPHAERSLCAVFSWLLVQAAAPHPRRKRFASLALRPSRPIEE